MVKPRSKILWIDIESTGLDPVKNDIWQLAYIIEIDRKIEHEDTYRIRPYNIENYSLDALKAARITPEDLEALDYNIADVVFDLKEIWGKYIDKYDKNDKFVMAGYNVSFDHDFLYEMFHKAGDRYGLGSWVFWPTRDVKTYVADVAIVNGIRFPNFKLATVCERFGIKFDAHDALEDIRATKKLYEKLVEIRDAIGT
jgi:DNA polymerase-3 subunit epsilon